MADSVIFALWLLVVVGLATFVGTRVRKMSNPTHRGLTTRVKAYVWGLCFLPALALGVSVGYAGTIFLAILLFGITMTFDFWFVFALLGFRPIIRPVARVGIRLRNVCRLTPTSGQHERD